MESGLFKKQKAIVERNLIKNAIGIILVSAIVSQILPTKGIVRVDSTMETIMTFI